METTAQEQEDENLEGMDFFALLSEEIMSDESPPPSPPNDFSEEFRNKYLARASVMEGRQRMVGAATGCIGRIFNDSFFGWSAASDLGKYEHFCISF